MNNRSTKGGVTNDGENPQEISSEMDLGQVFTGLLNLLAPGQRALKALKTLSEKTRMRVKAWEEVKSGTMYLTPKDGILRVEDALQALLEESGNNQVLRRSLDLLDLSILVAPEKRRLYKPRFYKRGDR